MNFLTTKILRKIKCNFCTKKTIKKDKGKFVCTNCGMMYEEWELWDMVDEEDKYNGIWKYEYKK